MAWAPDGQRIASASYDNTVRLWDAASGRLLNTLSGHENWVFSVAWAPDGQRIASASYDNTARLWDAKSGKELQEFKLSRPAHLARWEPDGGRLGDFLRAGLH